MKARTLPIGLVALSLLAGISAWSFAQPPAKTTEKTPDPARQPAKEEADEEEIPFAKAPEPVRKSALKLVGAGGEKAIKKVIKEEDEDDTYTYEIEYTADGADCSAILSSAGDVMELEKAVAETALPAAALEALKKEYPGATFKGHSLVQKFYYEVDVVINGKTNEIKIDAAGDIEDEHDQEHGKGEKHEEHDGKKGEGKHEEKDKD